MQSADFNGRQQGCVVVYDETYGSLRLTERLFLEFEHILTRVIESLKSEPEDDKLHLKEQDVTRIQEEVSKFTDSSIFGDEDEKSVPTGKLPAYKPGSHVLLRDQIGTCGIEVVVVQPTIMDGEFMYQIKDDSNRQGKPPAKRWVLASRIQLLNGSENWELAWWNPLTEEYDDEPSE